MSKSVMDLALTFQSRSSTRLLLHCRACLARQSFIRQKSGWSHDSPRKITLSNGIGEITVGKYARLANGSAVASCGGTSVLVTAVTDPSQPAADDFLPLTVDYRQKASAAGRIPTNFFRRELGQSHADILTSRVIDRSLRPMFPKYFNYETQICCNLLAYDRANQSDILAINAASAALAVSDIPWDGPIGAVRIGMINDEFCVNPTRADMVQSDLDLTIAATPDGKIVMLEGSASEIPDFKLNRALSFGLQQASAVGTQIAQLAQQVQPAKLPIKSKPPNALLVDWLRNTYKDLITTILSASYHSKHSRDNALAALTNNAVNSATQQYELHGIPSVDVRKEFSQLTKNILRGLILYRNIRPDGRGPHHVRRLGCEVNLYPSLHGSALFQRGQTQVMATVTLDSLESMTRSDPVSEILVGRSEKNFMLHYEFPQYATGDIGKAGGINRREIGHGALAEKGLRSVIPADFPFTIRVTSEVLESNGSSSMASVCAGSLALMDAGVPITNPAAGVAMGLVTHANPGDTTPEYTILTDILGFEDYAGDMDFKIAGTKRGITALQADLKLPGVESNIIIEALKSARTALNFILGIMYKCSEGPRADKKETWPVTETIEIPITKRSMIIGVAGSNIKRIQQDTGVTITSVSDTKLEVYAPNQDALNSAKQLLQECIDKQKSPEFEFGNVYAGRVVDLQPKGAYIQVHEALNPVFVKNSQLDLKTIYHSEASGLVLGDNVYIKYFGVDPATGQERWSRRALLSAGGYSKRLLPKDQLPYYEGKGKSAAADTLATSDANLKEDDSKTMQ